MAPHWARNGGQVSIAVSCNFDLASVQRLALVYKTNQSASQSWDSGRDPRATQTWSNGAKLLGARTVVAMRGLLRPQAATRRENAGWAPLVS